MRESVLGKGVGALFHKWSQELGLYLGCPVLVLSGRYLRGQNIKKLLSKLSKCSILINSVFV